MIQMFLLMLALSVDLGWANDVGTFRYVVTHLPSRQFHDVTNGDVPKRSESGKAAPDAPLSS